MIEIHAVTDSSTLDDARVLIRAHLGAHSTVHDAVAADALVARLPAPYLPPEGGLWIARFGDEVATAVAAGCVALQPLSGDAAEMKRMYVRPECRARGVARALAVHVVAEARARGYQHLRLGTLTTMHAAQALYTSLGFRPIAPYRAVEFGDTLFFELSLAAMGA